MYRVLLNNEEIGVNSLESGDPPMGVVSGKISFHPSITPFRLFLDHCRAHTVTLNSADPEFEFIDTQVIPQLRVVRTDGVEISGVGCCITGFKGEGYEVTILGIPYPFYAEEFPHHRKAYDDQFKS